MLDVKDNLEEILQRRRATEPEARAEATGASAPVAFKPPAFVVLCIEGVGAIRVPASDFTEVNGSLVLEGAAQGGPVKSLAQFIESGDVVLTRRDESLERALKPPTAPATRVADSPGKWVHADEGDQVETVDGRRYKAQGGGFRRVESKQEIKAARKAATKARKGSTRLSQPGGSANAHND